ncbi:MAG: nicotinate (nicotinamide) nucleotide adenylyltransferase [Phycisphaerales bacterium]|nr:nicotinate (nicotinamide) nucleotide adenylyltransferase [Phycisphaerales bacterium]
MAEESSSIPKSDSTQANQRPIVLVPLEYERKGLLSHIRNADFDLEVCGPGGEGIRRWAGRNLNLQRPVILAGLGGGLDPELAAGTVLCASEVHDPHGPMRQAPLSSRLVAPDLPRARFTSSLRTVGTLEAKADLFRTSGSQLVDLESVTFAQLGELHGWAWGVLRVVSDTAEDLLPSAVDHWVDYQGRTRVKAVGRDLFRRPNLLPHLRRMKDRARVGLQALGEALMELRLEPDTTIASPSPDSTPQVLIFGGSFDPPYLAHVNMPFEVAFRLGCNRVIFVPARINPLKTDTPPSDSHHRLEMLRQALADGPPATISRCEVEREGPSYMVDTLTDLRSELRTPDGRAPKLRLLLGSDQVLTFDRWHEWRRILDLATPAVVLRPPLNRIQFSRQVSGCFDAALARQWTSWVVDLPQSEANSSDIRDRIARGEDTSDTLDPQVRAYADAHGLYR